MLLKFKLTKDLQSTICATSLFYGYFFLNQNQQTMSQLQQRRDKVQRLTNQALKDKMHHKYIQGVYLLNQIAIRELQLFSNRINNLNKC